MRVKGKSDPALQMMAHANAAESMLLLLANAKRLAILCYLLQGEAPAGKLSEISGLSHSAVSQHLSRLRAHGIVDCEKRGRSVFYRIRSMEANAILSTLHLIYCR